MKKKKLFCALMMPLMLLCGCSTSMSESSTEMTYHLSKEELYEKLSTAKLGVQLGGLNEINATNDFPNAEAMSYSGNTDTLSALDSKKVDYALVPDTIAQQYIEANDYTFEYCDTDVYTYEISYALEKGNDSLKNQMDEQIKKLREDGTLDALYQKWAVDKDYSTDDIPHLTGKDVPVIRAAISSTNEPITFVSNGECAGYACDVLERVAYALGMRVEYQEMAFASMIPSIKSGKSDIAVSVTPTDERKKEVDFTEAFMYEHTVAVSRKANAASGSLINSLKKNFTGTFITENRWKLFVSGVEVTVVISVFSYLLGTIIGALLCLMLLSKNKVVSAIAKVYCKLSTGIPILVWLMILYYIVFKEFDISGIIVAIIAFGLQTGASLSGIFKTGIDSVDVGQKEAAEALGFNELTIFKKIIFPQAALKIFDLYKGEFVSVVKTTSIVGYVAISDLTKVSDIVRSRTYQAFFPLIATAIIYFVVTYLFILLLNAVQKKINPKLRKHILKGVKR